MDVDFYRFRSAILCLAKFGPKIQNCLFIMKFYTYINTNMQSSTVMFTISAFN